MCNSVKSLMILGLGLLAACATTTMDDESVQPANSWVIQFEDGDTECRDYDETYRNQGESQADSENTASSVYLSELMFSRLPGGLLPDSVNLVTNSQAGELSVILTGDKKRYLQYEITCHLGWNVLRKSRTGQYLGDGVVEKHFGQISFFRQGDAGELIVRVLVDAEFNSMYLFNSGVHAENWYRFEPVSTSQQ